MRVQVEDNFREAEGMFREQMATEQPDLAQTRELYTELAEQDTVPELAERARMRIESIDRERRTDEAVERFEEVQDDLRQKLADAQEEYRKALEEKPEEAADPVNEPSKGMSIGWVVKSLQLNPFDQSLPAHRLVKGGKTMMLLSSYKYDLRDFVDKQVRMTGERVALDNAEIEHMVVRKMEIISER